jgi:uncharacterized protein (TIGR02466 family)
MSIDFLFPQFIYSNIVNIDCEQLKKYCYDKKNNTEGVIRSNVGGWHSEDLNDENVFFTHIKSDLKKLADILQIPHLSFKLLQFWVNINQKNNFNIQHQHPSSFLSGVLYVKVPKNSGKIVFLDPSKNIRYCYEQYWGISNSLPLNNVFSKEWSYSPIEKQLILFPSWLEHYVQPNMSDEERISIAFNIGVKA